MSRKKTHNEFVNELNVKHPQIEVLQEYITAKTRIKFRCKAHQYEFNYTPDAILKSVHGCKYCAIEYVTSCKKKCHEQFVEEIGDVADKIEFIGKYKTMKDKIDVKCKKCGHIWGAYPDALMAGHACKKCAMEYVQNNNIKTHEQFIQQIKKYNFKSNTFEVISKYQKDELPVKCKCKKCGKVWETKAHNLISKTSPTACPFCSFSKGEMMVQRFLEQHSIQYESQKIFEGLIGVNGGNLRFDFYLPKYNLAIEYQGEYHDGSVINQPEEKYLTLREHDLRKKKFCKSHDIELMEIWYPERDKINDILTNKLLTEGLNV